MHQLPPARVPVAGEGHRRFLGRVERLLVLPFSGSTLKTLAADIEGYSQTNSALHFDKPLPAALVKTLLKARIAECGRSK